jgi:hypothetical protein
MSKAIPLVLLVVLLLIIASVASIQLETMDSSQIEMLRSPFITCDSQFCLEALERALNSKCKGDLCIDIVKQNNRVCKTCAIEISEGKHYSMIEFSNGDKLKSILCRPEIPLHVSICRFHCALDYKKNYQCAIQSIQVNSTIFAQSLGPICTCS